MPSILNWIVGLHSLIRWAILVLLIINMINSYVEANTPYTKDDIKWNFRLLIFTHINVLIGLIQYFFGEKGFKYFLDYSVSEVMKSSVMRFWAVEHITGMLIAAVVITITRGVTKKNIPDGAKHKRQAILYTVALIIILISIPWPFRIPDVPWFRNLSYMIS